ncbi:hypothetical protein [Shewanella sp. Scap07]|nr:hypothetical protein [Shewanella sp. Scap07]
MAETLPATGTYLDNQSAKQLSFTEGHFQSCLFIKAAYFAEKCPH